MLTYVGSLSPGQCVPMALLAQGKLSASIGLVLPELQARLEGMLAASVNLSIQPPTLAANLEIALALVAQLQAAIELGLPSASIDLTLIASLIAELQISLGALQLDLQWSLAFGLILGTPGIHLYAHEGAVGDVLPGGLPGGTGPNQPAIGVLLLATDSGAIAALQAMFRTS